MAATLALSAESFVGRAEMVTGSYEISPGAYVETLHGARTVPTAEGAHATNPRRRKGVYSGRTAVSRSRRRDCGTLSTLAAACE